MALVNNDKLKVIGRQFQIVAKRYNFLAMPFFVRLIQFIFGILVAVRESLSRQNSIEFLNSGNYNIAIDILFFLQSRYSI